MKKIFTFLFAGAAIAALGATFTACNEPNGQEQNEEGTEIQPVPVNEMNAEVVAFLGKDNLNLIVKTLIDNGRLIPGTDCCIMINNVDELPKIDYEGNRLEYPVIDFDSHTLIFGVLFMSHTGWIVSSQSVIVGAEKTTVNVSVEEDLIGFTIPVIAHFWGLYPKLPNLPIDVVRE